MEPTRISVTEVKRIMDRGEPINTSRREYGSPYWEHSELIFEKKEVIPLLHRLLTLSVSFSLRAYQ